MSLSLSSGKRPLRSAAFDLDGTLLDAMFMWESAEEDSLRVLADWYIRDYAEAAGYLG